MEIPEGDLDLLAIGETVVDMISTEEVERIRDARHFARYQGGSPANLARYVAALGKRAALVSKTGADDFGHFLKAELAEAGVSTEALIMDPAVYTTTIFITRTPGTADSLALRQADYRLSPDEIDAAIIGRARIVHASTFALSREPARSAIAKAFRLAHAQGKLISLDPNYNPPVWPDREEALAVLRGLFRYVRLTKPSLDDAERLFGPGETPEAYIARYHAMGPELVVFTMGRDGILLSQAENITHIPAAAVKVVDATGAGDAFWAGFLVALLDGNPPMRCALFAREVVRRKLTRVGPPRGKIARARIYATLPPPATS
ncbi:MAG: carbohydrate kinase family protein [Anaerolineae bacterium]